MFLIKKGVVMKISIEYCTKWNYKPRASSLGDELKKDVKADVELIPSSGGVFEVVAEGKLIFSKKSLNRFPEDGEIVHLINS